LAKNSYFQLNDIESFKNMLKKKDESPEWLLETLDHLEEIKELIPPEEDENRFVVEYIYPH